MKKIILSLGIMVGLIAAPLAPITAHAQVHDGLNAVGTSEINTKKIDGEGGVVNRIINILLWAIGILSVAFIIWGGIRFIISNGDASKITAARHTIVYAVVGLIFAIFSYAIVQFVTSRL